MYTIHKRSQPAKAAAKGLVKLAIFGIMISGALFPTAYVPSVNLAHAAGSQYSSSSSSSSSNSSSSSFDSNSYKDHSHSDSTSNTDSQASSTASSSSSSDGQSHADSSSFVKTSSSGDSSSTASSTSSADAKVDITSNHGKPCPSSTADIAVTKTADATDTTEGSIVHFTITVTDKGPATSTDVVASDPMPWGLTFVNATASTGTYSTSTGKWTIGTLANGQSATLVITAQVNSGIAGTTGVNVHNTVTVSESSKETDPNTSNNTSTVTICVEPCPPTTTVPYADLAVVKTVDNANPREGDTVNYTIVVTDNGPATSTGVVASDTVPSGLTLLSATTSQGTLSADGWTIGTLAPNATATLTAAAKVNSGTAGQTIVNTVTVTEATTTIDNNLSNNSSSASITVQSNGGGCGSNCPVYADISVSKTADVTSTVEGGTVNYTITAKDLGPATSTGVVATDTLPSGLTLVNATASQGSYSTSTGSWTIGTLANGQSATLEIAATANAGTAGTDITNTVTIGESTSTTDTNMSNNTSSVTVHVNGGSNCGANCADIGIVKTVDNATPNPGDTINYTLTVTDHGPATSTNVVAHDQLPPSTELSFVSATTSQGSYSLGTGDWTIGTLAPNATATLYMTVVVGNDQAGNTITNTSTVSELSSLIDNNPSNNTSTATIVVQTPGGGGNDADIAVTKTVDNAAPHEGDTVNYTITATDLGPANSTGVVATDTLPSGLTLVSATASAGTYSTSTGAWTIGNLAANATATLEIAAKVNAGTAGTSIANTAVISESPFETDTNLANNSSTATINVQSNGGGCSGSCGGGSVPTAEIGIVKTVDNANPNPGATIHYTLTVTGSGPNPSIGVVANDTLPADVTFVSASTSIGTYNSATGVWTIGNMTVGQSVTLVITATVNSTDPAGEQITNTGTVTESPAVNDQNSTNNKSSVTITVGGGGGPIITVPGGGGTVLGTSTTPGQVLGASCGLYLDQYIHPIRKNLNDPNEVKKLQVFLNQNLGINLPITGYYGSQTIAAVNQFQVKYHDEVLSDWVALGLPNQFTPTDYVYQTTWRWINLIECPSLNLPMPTLQVDHFATTYTYAF